MFKNFRNNTLCKVNKFYNIPDMLICCTSMPLVYVGLLTLYVSGIGRLYWRESFPSRPENN